MHMPDTSFKCKVDLGQHILMHLRFCTSQVDRMNQVALLSVESEIGRRTGSEMEFFIINSVSNDLFLETLPSAFESHAVDCCAPSVSFAKSDSIRAGSTFIRRSLSISIAASSVEDCKRFKISRVSSVTLRFSLYIQFLTPFFLQGPHTGRAPSHWKQNRPWLVATLDQKCAISSRVFSWNDIDCNATVTPTLWRLKGSSGVSETKDGDLDVKPMSGAGRRGR